MTTAVGPGVFKPSYARAPFVFAMAGAAALPGPVLADLMSVLEGTPASNKALLHRMSAGGSLQLTRVGRVGVYRMGGRLLTGFTAVRGDGSLRSSGWDGRFQALIYDIPESSRRARDRFLMAAFQVGYRSVRPGLLISPSDEHHLLAAIGDLGVQTAWITFPAEETSALVERVWQLDRFRAEYEEAVAAAQQVLDSLPEKTAPIDGATALRDLYDVVAARTALLLRDGALPAELTPPGWPADDLRILTAEIERKLAPAARVYVRAAIDRSPHAHLREPDGSWPD